MSNKFGMSDFFTREAANEGIEIPLRLPTGVKTDHWIRIRGVDSDEFRLAETKAVRRNLSIAAMTDENERNKADAENRLELVSALVIAWSFPEECNAENVTNFLRNAPQIADQINTVAASRSRFFEQKSNNLQHTPKANSGSTKGRKVANKQ